MSSDELGSNDNKRKREEEGDAPVKAAKKPYEYTVCILLQVKLPSDVTPELANDFRNAVFSFFEGPHTVHDANGEFELPLDVLNVERGLIGVHQRLATRFVHAGVASLITDFKRTRPQSLQDEHNPDKKVSFHYMVFEVHGSTQPISDFF